MRIPRIALSSLAAGLGCAALFAASPASAEIGASTTQVGTAFEDVAIGVAVDSVGMYLVGQTRGALPGQTSAGNWDAFVRRYDLGGRELWTRQFGAEPFGSFDTAGGVATVAGAVYVGGTIDWTLAGQTSAGFFDGFLRKYADDGTELWTRQFGSTSIPLVFPDDRVNGVAADATGVYVGGDTMGVLPGQTNAGGSDAFVRKFDHDGNVLWTRQFGTAEDESAAAIAVDTTGVYVAGETWGAFPGFIKSGINEEVFVRKYDLEGNELWTRQFITQFGRARANAVAARAGQVFVVGDTGTHPSSGAFVRVYELDGNVQWVREFGSLSNTFAAGVAVDATGVQVVGEVWRGALPGQYSSGRGDAFLRRYDLNGNELWTRQFGPGSATAAASNGSDVFVAGHTAFALPGQESAGNSDAFLVRVFDRPGTDTTPPVITCPTPPPAFLLGDPNLARIVASAADGESGPLVATPTVEVLSTGFVGPQGEWVRAADWAGNVGAAVCSFSVVYRFSSPLASPPQLHKAKAGSFVALDWRVTRYPFVSVTDPGHFVGVTERDVSCPEGAPLIPVKTYAKQTGLENLGEGHWRYGWKTKGAYKKSCQEVTINLADGTGHMLLFRFDD